MITADTITDEQIAELADLARAHRENDLDTYRIAMTALEDGSARRLAEKIVSNWSMPVPSIAEGKLLAHAALGHYRDARARCAEILNAREASKVGAEVNAKCQALDCGNDACWETYASNEHRPDMGGTQVCDDHLVEPGLCQAEGLPYPESWTVIAIHEGSPPYCSATCPTCHSKAGAK